MAINISGLMLLKSGPISAASQAEMPISEFAIAEPIAMTEAMNRKTPQDAFAIASLKSRTFSPSTLKGS